MPCANDPVARLKREIGEELARAVARHDTWDVAVFIRADPPRVSDLRHGKLQRFSLETLVRYLDRLGYRVEMRWERRRFNEHLKKG